MKLTWYGHSTFSIELKGSKLFVDPFFTGAFASEDAQKKAFEGTTHVLLTHGHDDHIGSTIEICKSQGAMLIANFELCNYLVAKGVPADQINPGNYGGTLDCSNFSATFVQAFHSSSSQIGDGKNIYLGNPAGIVIHCEGEKTLYHMGDTDIFGDMALINELHQPEIGIVPVGDRFTMGGAVAALACRRYFKFSSVIPCHFGTFPVLDPDASKFVAAMEDGADIVQVMDVGQSMEF